MGLFEKDPVKIEVKKLLKKAESLIGDVYFEKDEVNNLIYREILSKKKYFIPIKNDFLSEDYKKLLEKAKTLGCENFYYLIEKGMVLSIYEFLIKEEINDFFIVKVRNSDQRIIFKEHYVGNFITKGPYSFVRTNYKGNDIKEKVIKRFIYRINAYNKLSINDFEKLLIDKNKKISLEALLKS